MRLNVIIKKKYVRIVPKKIRNKKPRPGGVSEKQQLGIFNPKHVNNNIKCKCNKHTNIKTPIIKLEKNKQNLKACCFVYKRNILR